MSLRVANGDMNTLVWMIRNNVPDQNAPEGIMKLRRLLAEQDMRKR